MPAYVRGAGSAASAACPALSGDRCPADGSGNFVERELEYDAVLGAMRGSVTSNNCPDHAIEGRRAPAPDCQRQEIPDPSFREGPAGAPLLGRVGLALSSGVNVYGPFEAGFTEGQICEGGSCEGGVDVATCERKMAHECSIDPSDVGIIDTCGGHADPYHYHEDLKCQPGYDGTPELGAHSPALAVALDGRLVYGKFEDGGLEAAGSLDACNGHFGPVPANPELGVPASCTYHYHTVGEAPFTLGCFGPVGSLDQCRILYAGCGTGFLNFTVWAAGGSSEEVSYDSWCPCYQHAADTGVCMSLGPGGGAEQEEEEEDEDAGERTGAGNQAGPPAPRAGESPGPSGSSAFGGKEQAGASSTLRDTSLMLAVEVLAGTVGLGVVLVGLRWYRRRQSETKQGGLGLGEEAGRKKDTEVQLQELRVA